MDLFSFSDYKAFLKSRLERGYQQHFAQHLRCQPAFLSQVLRGKPHLSLEQGILATDYFQLNRIEVEYFMLTLHFGRAGSVRLKDFYKSKMEEIKESQQRVDVRIGKFEKMDEISKATFFSSWKYAITHVLLSIPASNQVELIKVKTGLSEKEISNVLSFLKTNGLIEKQADKWHPTKKRVHLSSEASMINSHHKNFRSLSLKELEDPKNNSLHFSAAFALSQKDAAEVRSIFLNAISKTETILKPSVEETLRVISVDIFEPGAVHI